MQLHWLHAGMTLNGEQRIRCFHRTVLPGVARKDNARIPFLGEPEQSQHLPPANLPGFINYDYSALRQFSLGEKAGDRRRGRKSRLFHIHNLLMLRCENSHGSSRLLDLLGQLMQHKTLPCARATAKDRNQIGRAEQAIERFAATARQETDLEALSAELLAVVAETMQPEHVTLWMMPKQVGRRQTDDG